MHTSANFIMCRDPGCSVGSNFTINRFVQDTRNLEAVVWKHVFENVPEFAGGAQLLHTNDPHGETIEGGDIAILSPEVIAIGGGLCGAGEFLFGPLQDKVTEKCFYPTRGALVPAVMGNDAGVVGAAMLRRDAELKR